MKKLVSAAFTVFLTAGAAMAADMPVKVPLKAPPVAAFDWTGFYLGGHVGYGVARDGVTTASAFTDNTAVVTSFSGDSFAMGPAGVLGGLQAGYNWQFAPSWVAGVEADWSWTNQNDSACVLGCFPGGSFTVQQRLDWLATLRGRLGYAHDGWLWYVTGGAAWGRVKETDNLDDVFGAPPATAAFDQTRLGWAAGVGVETAIAGNWTGKLEYLHVDLGSLGSNTLTQTSGPAGFTEVLTVSRGDFRDNIVRLGLNYRFAGPVQMATASLAFAAVPYNWTGFYLGGNVGYSVGHNQVAAQHDPFSPVESFTLSPAGAAGGGQFGYNWQFASNWVLGAEIDGQWAGQKDSSCTDSCNFVPQPNAAAEVVSIDQQLRWLATARGRVGYAMGDWLAYVTGGAALGGIRDNYLLNVNGISTITQSSHTKGGWAMGTGIETALAGRWTAKLEYLYVDLGTVTDAPANVAPFGVGNISTRWQDHIVRAGVNYRFGG